MQSRTSGFKLLQLQPVSHLITLAQPILRAAGLALLLMFPPAVYSQALTDDPSIINDHMFPAQAAAKPFSDFDSKGFLINGKRTFLVSAGIEYARVPHQLWEDRLLRLKRGGFNCVEIYTIWNFHEAVEGKFEFSADHDLDGFLALLKKLGMYAIVRVGPYYCAEWDQGGYPIWLRFKEGLRVREPNAVFEKYVDRFFDHLLPVVMKHQIHKGGAVVLVQLENEHPKGWGTIVPDQYFKHLQEKALSMGMEVPYFFSGVHHSTDPAGDGKLDDAARPNPWFSTEYWSMWYTQYGAKKGDAAKYDRSTWKIIANGGNGYNIYMAYGGSNFGYTNNDEDAASYDYGAAVGQAGDLRPLYYTFKRAAYFGRSFQDILENNTNAGKKYNYLLKRDLKTPDTSVRVIARTGIAGDLVFLDNSGHKKATVLINANQEPRLGSANQALTSSVHRPRSSQILPEVKINLNPAEIYPLVHNFRLNSSVMLEWALTRVYGLLKQNHTTTILVQAETAEQVVMRFLLKDKTVAQVVNSSQSGTSSRKASAVHTEFILSGNTVLLNTVAKAGRIATGSNSTPAEYSFKAGQEVVRILVMSKAELDHTWFTENPDVNGIVAGVPYLGEVQLQDGKIIADAESPFNITAASEKVPFSEKSFSAEQGSLFRKSSATEKVSSSGKSSPSEKVSLLRKSSAVLTGGSARIYLEKGSQLLIAQPHKQSVGKESKVDKTPVMAIPDSIDASPQLRIRTVDSTGRMVPTFRAGLSSWMHKNAALAAAPDYDDSKWLASENPLQMGADQDITANAWYRTEFSVPEKGKYAMQAEGGDRGTIFIDGRPAVKWKIKTGEVSLNLDKGEHTMAIFTAHNGRDKMAAYLGPIENIDKKGLDGKIKLRKGGPFYQTLENWYFLKAGSAEALKSAIPALDTLQWKKYKIGADAFNLKEGFGWFATTIPAQPGLAKMNIAFKSVDENATVFINGKQMIRREGWNIPFEFTITDTGVLSHDMILTVFVENHDKEGGIDQPVKINTIGDAKVITGWKMRGGPDEVQATWQNLDVSDTDTLSGPQYYRSAFTLPQIKGIQLIWRVNPDEMGHGSVWVNGHHIGRYPELNGRIGMYIPEPWLKQGKNELLIYEEEGKQPVAVSITAENEAGRKIYQLISQQLRK